MITMCPSNQRVDIEANAATTPTATVTFPVAVATDSSGNPVNIQYTSAPAVTFQVNAGTVTASGVRVGTTVVTVTATDSANNPATCPFNIVGNSGNASTMFPYYSVMKYKTYGKLYILGILVFRLPCISISLEEFGFLTCCVKQPF